MGDLCVIGHGPSPLKRRWGELIDKQSVVRLKDPGWQLDKQDHYGKRTDYICASAETIGVAASSRVKGELWAFPKRLVAPRMGRCDMKLAEKWILRFREMWDHGTPNFCIGVSAYLYACEWVKPDRVILVGFDNFFNPSLEYHKAQIGKWRSGHNWRAERQIADWMAREYGIPYVNAEDEWSDATASLKGGQKR